MRKSIAIIGLSRFGLSLVETLSKLDVDLIAIDNEAEVVSKVGEYIKNALIADSTNLESLREAGIKNVDHAIVALGQNERVNLTTSIITVIKLKELGVKEITARADDEDYAEILRLVGANHIVMPLLIASERVAYKLVWDNVLDYFNVRGSYDLYEVKVGPNFKPVALADFDARTRFKINILLVESGGETFTPTKDTIIKPDDEVYIFGNKKDIPKVLAALK